jgi:glycosyltransferase involved in cell wall biosynthesis
VVITGPTSAIADAYAACDLVLQLSRKPEAFGRTVVEALAVGRAVLGWDHGGVGELLHELQPEGAVPAFDPLALRAQAHALLGRRSRPAATMTAIPATYLLRTMQDATLSVYDELR